MGDSLIRHSTALLRAKDPFLRRAGAYRLAFIASNDETRMKIIDAGALPHLLLLLDSPSHHSRAAPPLSPLPLSPSENHTLKEALNCLASLAVSDTAAHAMVAGGAVARLQQAAVWISQLPGDHRDELLGPLDALVVRLASVHRTRSS
ncbi:hypothetical protein CLOM_g10972 [Closterium sp. NIES-68]|nr:hypothetical protein CLOM_g10972 [Closterium sp. NIES-68]